MKRNKTELLFFQQSFDYPLFIVTLLLSFYGLVIVKSATHTMADGGIRIFLVQLIGMFLGVFSIWFLTQVNFHSVKDFIGIIYGICAILLVVVLRFGSGEETLGSKSWIDLGFISFQPSEIAKIGMIIITATFLERIRLKKQVLINWIKLFLYSGSLIGLVLLEKDYGTTIVFIFIFLVMIFIAGIKYRYVVIGFLGACITLPLFWIFVLNETRKDRIRVFLNPELDPLDAGFNVIQSKIAIGSGRLFGQGLFEGYQNKLSMVPVKESDFIFSVVGEELGFIGALILILLFAFFLIRITNIAFRAKTFFSKYLVMGICAMYTFHYIENIAMSMGLMPVTGIPLPFISAGGTSLLTNFISIGIVLSISARKGSSI